MTFGQPTTLSAVLLAFRQQLGSAVAGLDPAYIALSIDEAWDPDVGLPSDFAVAIQRYRGRSNAADYAGAGNDCLTWECTCEVVVWARLSVDDAGRDLARLTDPTLGIIAKWTAVLSALQGFCPVDATDPSFKPVDQPTDDTVSILEEPMRCIDFTVRRVRKTDWSSILTPFEFKFRQAL